MADVEKPEENQTVSEDAPAAEAKSAPKKRAATNKKVAPKKKAAPKKKQASKTSVASKAPAAAASKKPEAETPAEEKRDTAGAGAGAVVAASVSQPSESKAAPSEQSGVEETNVAKGRHEPSPVAPETQAAEATPTTAPPAMEAEPTVAPPETQVPEAGPAAMPEVKIEQAKPAVAPPPPAEKPRSGLSAAVLLWAPLLILGVLIYALADKTPMPEEPQADMAQAPAVVAAEGASKAAGALSEKDEAAVAVEGTVIAVEEAPGEVIQTEEAVAKGASRMPGEGPDVPQFMPGDVEPGLMESLSIPLAPSPDPQAVPAPAEPSGTVEAVPPATIEAVPAVPLGVPEAPAFATKVEPPDVHVPGVPPPSMEHMAKGLSAAPEYPEPPSFEGMLGSPPSYGPYGYGRRGPGRQALPGYRVPSASPGPGARAYYPPRAGAMVGQDLGEPPPPPPEEAWPRTEDPQQAGPWSRRSYPPRGPYTWSPGMAPYGNPPYPRY